MNRCIHRKSKFTIHSNENPTYADQHIGNTPLKMHLQHVLPDFSKPSKYIFQLHQSPSGLHHKKTSLSDLQDCLIWAWKHISKLPGEKGYAYRPERILDDMFSTIHGFSTLAANIVYHSRFLHPGRNQ